MIKKLTIKNFRCYENTTVVFQGISILVGCNNAGKSTLIEALKVIATVVRKYKNLSFSRPPEWVPNETDNGVSPSMENQNISDKGLFTMYGEPPAVIEATFSNGCAIRAYVGEGLSVFALIIGNDGNPIRNGKAAKQVEFPPVEVLPQISALRENETIINRSTVIQNKNTRLSSKNFRNQLYYNEASFPQFKSLVESTWEGLQVSPVETNVNDAGQLLQFLVRNHGFTAEIGWMGHGLQMWVQCMWFLSQCRKDAVVILDEPDVYMHADLQRRLIRLVSPMFSQLIIATHSIEIMEEVLPESIIPVDSGKRMIKSVGNHAILQQMVEGMGSVFNLDLARLFISKRFVVWEGPDTDRLILSKFQSVLYPNSLLAISSFPKTHVGGWGGWQRALAISSLFNNNQIHVKCYCLFDSDYHTIEDIKERKQEAVAQKVNLHIWSRKEIENYAICANAILRLIMAKKRKGKITLELLENKMKEIEEGLKENVQDGIASEIQKRDKSLDYSTVRRIVSTKMRVLWKQPLNVIPGKTFIKRLSEWSSKEYGVCIQAMSIIPFFEPAEVPQEIKDVISTIIEGRVMTVNCF